MEIQTVPTLWRGIPAALNLIMDITEQKKAEESLKQSEERYRRLMQRSFDAVVVHRNGIITLANQSAAILIGASSPREIIGKKVLDFVHPDFKDFIKKRMETMIGGSEMSAVDAAEEKFLRIDGKSMDVEVVATGFLEDDQPTIQVVFREISERKRAENALMENQKILTSAMDLAHLADWELHAQTGIYTFNDRFYALYGTTAEREGGYQMPVDVYFREFVHPDDRNKIFEEIERYRKISDPRHVSQFEHRIIRRDGEIRYVVVRVERITDKNSHVIKIHGVNQDITERTQSQKALELATKKLNLLNHVTSNDIQT
jgi:PAS domain S-box-containing protein